MADDRHPDIEDHRLAGALPREQPAPAPWLDDTDTDNSP